MTATTLMRPEASQTTPAARPPMSRARKQWLLLVLVLGYGVALAVRLRNTAFIDEALYIDAGNAYLDHWFEGRPLGDAGAFFSGLPVLYPVLAALLDSAGGLYLVRAFSLVCVLGTAMALYATARHLWGKRAGLLAATTFMLSGPVIFTGWLGTFDALVILLLALGLWVGLTRHGYPSSIALGGVLTLAALTKYTAGIFVPVVLAATLALGVLGARRALVAAGVTLGLLTMVWAVWGEGLVRDVAFTTTARQALSPTTTGSLVALAGDHLVLLLLLAAVSLVLMFRTGDRRLLLLGSGLVLASMALPVGQMILGEAVSFEKHLAYSVMLLALPVGWGLARISRYPLMVTPVVITVMIMALFPLVRADAMYRWTNVQSVVTAIESDPREGLYISSATDALDYHTRDLPGIAWETTFELYFEGEGTIRSAVDDERYQTVILRTSSLGNPDQDAAQAVLLDALEESSTYSLAFEPFPASPTPGDNWLIYTRG
ncbi:ArnT family glycosyltransferase [Arthrobacter sp. L77]|uniref:ArnT family glycosyltransferase n=1 Tax=Arthrobacter sp. L77 TaxID=1496689 RepID=UPI0005B978C6|nr:glycosyltransferase family 39 protein [Arthrobacter sp. L77]